MKKGQDKIKTVFITGASSGIGRQVAYKFAKDKASLIITYNQNKEGAEKTAEECQKLGAGEILILPLNLTSDRSIKEAVSQITNKYASIDILINNAGYGPYKPLIEHTFEEITATLKINLEGLIKLTKLTLPNIQEAIINIGSRLGLCGKAKLVVYSATKFGVRGVTKSLTQELKNIKVYTVNPGLTDTKMGSPEGMDPKIVAEIIYNAATGKYKAKSGSDINVRDYQYGEFLGQIVKLLREIKGFIRL